METLKFLGKNYLVDKKQGQFSEGGAISSVSSSEVKQCSERSQIFNFNISESKNTVVSVVKYLILEVVKNIA